MERLKVARRTKNKFTEEQINALQMLKNEGLYLGEITRMKVG